jgi:recombination protein RecA
VPLTPAQQVAQAKKIVKVLDMKWKGVVKRGSDPAAVRPTVRIPTGCFTLDCISGGGLPLGRMVEFWGEYSTGKSLLLLLAIAEAQRNGYTCGYIEAENNWDAKLAEKLGIDLEALVLAQTNKHEEVVDIAEVMVSSGGLNLIGIDSIAALIPKAVREKKASEMTMGIEAKLNNLLARKCIAAMTDDPTRDPWCCLVVINQTRAQLSSGPYAQRPKPGGGQGLKFFKSISVEVRRGEERGLTGKQPAPGKPTVGHVIKLRIEKNRTFRPKLQGFFDYYYADAPDLGIRGGSIDTLKEMVTMGVAEGVVKQSGAFFTVPGTGEKAHGVEKLVEAMRNMSLEQLAGFRAAVIKKIGGIEDHDGAGKAAPVVEPDKEKAVEPKGKASRKKVRG